ncbi:MAG: hypothetical protein HFI87_03210 [Bacilli bacterium]|nr:hypothetical protein [Bacilli bacterium]
MSIYDFIKQYGMCNFIKHYGVYQDINSFKCDDCFKLFPIYKKKKKSDLKDIFRLYILVYVNNKDKFYFDYFFNHVSEIPKELIELYDQSVYSVPKQEELEAIGFIDYTKIQPLIKRYNKYSNYIVYQRYLEKVRNINDSSKIDKLVDIMNIFKKTLFDMANSNEDVIKVESLDKILTFEKR